MKMSQSDNSSPNQKNIGNIVYIYMFVVETASLWIYKNKRSDSLKR